MAGHSKRHNIKHKKAASDAKKAKIYTKIARLIELSAKSGSDPSLNPNLEAALQKAKANNLPKDIIERAIKKGSGKNIGENLEEVLYEGYGPGGVALIIKSITSNTNRTGSNIRAILSKFGGNMGEPGSVSWQFKEKGVIYVTGMIEIKFDKGKNVEINKPIDLDFFEDFILKIEIEDYEMLDCGIKIITSKSEFVSIKKLIEDNGFKIEQAEIEFIPDNYVDIAQSDEVKFEKLIELLEEDDDIENIYHNY